MISIVFLLVLVYNAEITAAEMTSPYTVSIGPRKELQGQKPTSTYLPGRLIREYIRYMPSVFDFIASHHHELLKSVRHHHAGLKPFSNTLYSLAMGA